MHPTNHLNGTPTSAETTNGATPPPEKKPAPGRDANGRFTKGNLGGPGNPFARQMAGFRRALCNAVTEQDITELAQLLLAKAKAGDLLAMKLLFQYTLGRPTEVADPDSLDAQEMRLFQQNNAESDAMTEMVRGTPADFAVEVLRVLLPTRSKQLAGTMGQMLRSQAETAAAAPPPSPGAGEQPEAKPAAKRAHSKQGAKNRRRRRQRPAGRPTAERFVPVPNRSTKRAAAAPLGKGTNGTGAPMRNHGNGGKELAQARATSSAATPPTASRSTAPPRLRSSATTSALSTALPLR